MISSYPRRLIEVTLPTKRISAHARREKAARTPPSPVQQPTDQTGATVLSV